METAVKFGINTVTIINNNHVFAQCSGDLQKVHEDNPEEGEIRYTFTDVNFSNVAREFGCFALRVEKPEDIGPAIKEALQVGRPAVIEVITDRNAITPLPLNP